MSRGRNISPSGIARRRETKRVSFAVFGALGENEEERVKENDEVVRVNEKDLIELNSSKGTSPDLKCHSWIVLWNALLDYQGLE